MSTFVVWIMFVVMAGLPRPIPVQAFLDGETCRRAATVAREVYPEAAYLCLPAEAKLLIGPES
ncbi:MAG TPA: hypothetical protein ENI87_05440 [bacterium]|nr:hypothetical protein [bacterium]